MNEGAAVIFVIARDIEVEAPAQAGQKRTVTIDAGEKVRLMPEFATSPTAHVQWRGEIFSCNRSEFLAASSPIGPAPD